MSERITVIGGGLAGCEAAWTIAGQGVPVTLIEMKPAHRSPAHRSDLLGELVCSNSLKAKRIDSAAGLLKEEMRRMNSLCVAVADGCSVPAGGALAVDRERFAEGITRAIEEHPLITVEHTLAQDLPADGLTVAATGPLTAEPLAEKIRQLCGGALSFYDAAAPIVEAASVDPACSFAASRYDREESGQGDYLNCPMNKEEYEAFHAALITAKRAPLHDFDRPDDKKVYEGCMPIEILAGRGLDAIRFGPMKPVGLRDPRTGHRPWAVLQLRRENAAGTMLGLVGFQTNLTFPEQKRVFGMIPALKNAVFVRYGVMHRNTFLDSPRLLDADLSLKRRPDLFFAGQITGVEGYMESAMAGIVAGQNALRRLRGEAPLCLPRTTMMGALIGYITDGTVTDFQPMGANFGILPPLDEPPRDKRQRYAALADRALRDLAPYQLRKDDRP
ncbi:MAG: methylenetetrahydrofolate--tRNA-(uracil(54)-C(5))-methyltransferase (FADH(2)-oxidizing) TrmFO [Acutalibacteraceae bacterium]